MTEADKLKMISNHLSQNETAVEKEEFTKWLEESKENQLLFYKIKKVLEEDAREYVSFRKKFNLKYLGDILVQNVLGNVIGFAIGLWVTNTFTHHVIEKKSVKNLFGLAGRKKIVVNDTPEWVQYSISFILGFIALELINYFFQSRQHILLYEYVKKQIQNYREKKEGQGV